MKKKFIKFDKWLIMIEETKDNEYISIRISKKVGAAGINRVKNYVKFLEINSTIAKKKVPQSVINKLSREINKSAWEKFKKARGIT